MSSSDNTILYYAYLCGAYQSIEDTRNFRVTEISIMKSPSRARAQHELLLAKVSDTKGGAEHHLTLEQSGLPETTFRRKSSSPSSLPQTSSSNSLTDSVKNLSTPSKITSSIDTPAHDQVCWQNPSGLQRVMRLQISENTPVYLCALLAIATAISRDFMLLNKNCYFYAGSIFALVNQLVKKDLPSFRREKSKAGSWNTFVQIFDDNKPEIVEMINDFEGKYTKEVELFLAKVRVREDLMRKAARADHAEERAEEERARAEAEAKLQEERAKAQQLEAIIRDLQAQMLASSKSQGPSIQLTDYHQAV
ncbi:hypothetical protein H0H93_004343 [Arthromyces matolae]|nr:hypothetical protein H0H93_004343 [Arthromyces matolae]